MLAWEFGFRYLSPNSSSINCSLKSSYTSKRKLVCIYLNANPYGLRIVTLIIILRWGTDGWMIHFPGSFTCWYELQHIVFHWFCSWSFLICTSKLVASPANRSAGPIFDSSIGAAVCISPVSLSSSQWMWTRWLSVMVSFWVETRITLSLSMTMDNLRNMPWKIHDGWSTLRTWDCGVPLRSTGLTSIMSRHQTCQLLLKAKDKMMEKWPPPLRGRERNASQDWKKIKALLYGDVAWEDFLHPFAKPNLAAYWYILACGGSFWTWRWLTWIGLRRLMFGSPYWSFRGSSSNTHTVALAGSFMRGHASAFSGSSFAKICWLSGSCQSTSKVLTSVQCWIWQEGSIRKVEIIIATASELLSLEPVLTHFAQTVVKPSGKHLEECKAYLSLAMLVQMFQYTHHDLLTPDDIEAQVEDSLSWSWVAGTHAQKAPLASSFQRPSQAAWDDSQLFFARAKHKDVSRHAACIFNTQYFEQGVIEEVVNQEMHQLSSSSSLPTEPNFLKQSLLPKRLLQIGKEIWPGAEDIWTGHTHTHTEAVPKWSSQQRRCCPTPWWQSWQDTNALERWERILLFDFPVRFSGEAEDLFNLARASGCWWTCMRHASHGCKDCSGVGPNESRHCDSHPIAMEIKTVCLQMRWQATTLAGSYMIHVDSCGLSAFWGSCPWL